jgi:hypothetical protein
VKKSTFLSLTITFKKFPTSNSLKISLFQLNIIFLIVLKATTLTTTQQCLKFCKTAAMAPNFMEKKKNCCHDTTNSSIYGSLIDLPSELSPETD